MTCILFILYFVLTRFWALSLLAASIFAFSRMFFTNLEAVKTRSGSAAVRSSWSRIDTFLFLLLSPAPALEEMWWGRNKGSISTVSLLVCKHSRWNHSITLKCSLDILWYLHDIYWHHLVHHDLPWPSVRPDWSHLAPLSPGSGLWLLWLWPEWPGSQQVTRAESHLTPWHPHHTSGNQSEVPFVKNSSIDFVNRTYIYLKKLKVIFIVISVRCVILTVNSHHNIIRNINIIASYLTWIFFQSSTRLPDSLKSLDKWTF